MGRIDWLGVLLSLVTVTAFLLALQWGGSVKPWSSPTVIVLLCISALILVVFVLWEIRVGANAILPMSIWKSQTQVGASLEAFFIECGLLIGTVCYLLSLMIRN